jgi:hypothetical protein
LRQNIIIGIATIDTLPTVGLLPSFQSNYLEGSRTTVFIDANLLNELVCMWGKGFHRLLWGKPVAPGATVEPIYIDEQHVAEVFGETEGRWGGFDGGPGVRANFLQGKDDSLHTTLCRFEIWGQFVTYAHVNETEARSEA